MFCPNLLLNSINPEFKKESLSELSLRLDSIIFKPGIIVSIDKKRDPICAVSTPKVKNLMDESIWAHPKNRSPTLIQRTFGLSPESIAICRPENVVE